MNTKIFGILAMVFVALAGTGVAFGHWYDPVYANVQVQTGTLQVLLTNNEGQPWVFGDQCSVHQGGLNPGFGNVVTATQCLNTPTNTTMTISICNAYPSIVVFGCFDVNNTGSIPAQFNGITFTPCAGIGVEQATGVCNYTIYNTTNGAGIATLTFGFSSIPAVGLFGSQNFKSYNDCFTYFNNLGSASKFCPGQEVYMWYCISFNYESIGQGISFSISSTLQFQSYENGVGGCPTS